MRNKPRYKYSSLRHGGAFLTQLLCRHEFKGYTKYGGVKLLCGIQQCRKCGRYRQVVT